MSARNIKTNGFHWKYHRMLFQTFGSCIVDMTRMRQKASILLKITWVNFFPDTRYFPMKMFWGRDSKVERFDGEIIFNKIHFFQWSRISKHEIISKNTVPCNKNSINVPKNGCVLRFWREYGHTSWYLLRFFSAFPRFPIFLPWKKCSTFILPVVYEKIAWKHILHNPNPKFSVWHAWWHSIAFSLNILKERWWW